jgi:hypothetical protein
MRPPPASQSVSQSVIESGSQAVRQIPQLLVLFEVNSEPHIGARLSVRLCVVLITGRRRRRPRRDFSPQAQAALQRQKRAPAPRNIHASTPPSYGQVTSHQYSEEKSPRTLLFCSSAECSSSRTNRSGHRHGHHDHVRATEVTV